MATKNHAGLSFIKNPFLLAVLLVLVVIVIVWVDQKDETIPPVASNINSKSTVSSQAPVADPPGMPQIVENINAQTANSDNQNTAGNVAAPGLDSLLTGLEQKVASDPGNESNRILLAQTYNELGMQEKAVASIREVTNTNPKNARATLVLASILSQSGDSNQLQESIKLLDTLKNETTVQQYLVNMYKGDALIRTQDHVGALKHYKLALENMPESDNRRSMLERRVENLSSGQSGEGKAGDTAQVKG